MLNLTSTDSIRIVSAAAGALEVHASWVDLSGTTVTPGRLNTSISTATTTTVVSSPAGGTVRNIKGLFVTNTSATVAQRVVAEHFDGTLAADLMGFTLLPGENMTFDEDGHWTHRDPQGAEYPPSALGAYGGYTAFLSKSGSGPEGAGYWYCSSKDAGFPGAWAPGVPGLNGRNTDGTTSADFGCMTIRTPTSGAAFITNVDMTTSVIASNLFFDCLWVNSGLSVTTTTAQNITMGTLPARDLNGTSDGVGCLIAMLFTAAATNAGTIANSTVSYTNSSGTAGRTATLTAIVGSQIPATPTNGTWILFGLQAGDQGVRSIQSITLGTSLVTGSVSLMVIRPVLTLGTNLANTASIKAIPSPGVRLYPGTCLLHAHIASAATATQYTAELTIQEK